MRFWTFWFKNWKIGLTNVKMGLDWLHLNDSLIKSRNSNDKRKVMINLYLKSMLFLKLIG